ncbi:hypothetical protein TcWFU_008843 [Taenia crassiceps]|uniref:CX domain-containing protein n=1 Tax=Taenia crassiceps TaxID=6207 RepID=A0ABR4QF23_9CEST
MSVGYKEARRSIGQQQYIVCPDSNASLLRNNTQNFCCGIFGSQYCCNEADFRQGIQIIRPSLPISPSILIGCALATLLAMMMAALCVYGRLRSDRNPREPVSIVYPQSQSYSSLGSHARNKGASSVPPAGRLLSSDPGRRSMRHNRRSHIEYDV